MSIRIFRTALLCGILSFVFVACQKSVRDVESDGMATAQSQKAKGGTAELKGTSFYALTASNEIVNFLSGNPLIERTAVSVTGLAAGERLLAIDFRPATGQLYGVSTASKIYTINLSTGAASAVAGPFTPAINGAYVGFDFNPTVDRIRLVTSAGQNLRLNPITGMVVAVDGNITPANTDVSAVAYTNSFAGATTTTLYDIDVATNMLYIQNPPNVGTLTAVGSLGVQAVGEAGFDIAPDNSVAIAALFGRGLEDDQMEESNGNKYRFYYINLATGEAKNAGKTNREIIGLAIAPNQL
jgi:3D (Asp-Asp-Asp) domain-containing protein